MSHAYMFLLSHFLFVFYFYNINKNTTYICRLQGVKTYSIGYQQDDLRQRLYNSWLWYPLQNALR